MTKKVTIFLVILLLILNIGAIFLLYRFKITADSITSATNNSGSQNANKFGFNSEELATEDVAGVDVPGITRFSRLVRTKYQKSNNGLVTIEYQTHDQINLVLAYYKTQLAKSDWIIDYAKDRETVFTKNTQKIVLKAVNNSGITTLTITY